VSQYRFHWNIIIISGYTQAAFAKSDEELDEMGTIQHSTLIKDGK